MTKFKFECQNARQKWFVLADNLIKTSFMIREKDFYEQLYLSNVIGKEGSKQKVFHVTIGSSKNTKIHNFHPHAPEIK